MNDVVFNGIDGTTGGYLTSPMPVRRMFDVLRGRDRPVAEVEKPLRNTDPRDLAATGWAIVYGDDLDPAVREALEPLVARRREQAGERFREIRGAAGTETRSARTFLQAQGSPGPIAEPERLPYYLLLVGGPREIPFELQYGLDVSHAVGRLSFDTPEEYARYAETVVAAEEGRIRRPRRADFLGPRNPDDLATEMSCDLLVGPLARELAARHGANGNGWEVRSHRAEDADRSRFTDVLGGGGTPAFAFTAGHGMGYPSGHRGQEPYQGALLCQDWPGPVEKGLLREHFFAAEDVTDTADVAGLISFHFACYGAGCPEMDDFAVRTGAPAGRRAPAPCVSRLPRRLLGHPRGGALAFVGHVDRAWAYSFLAGTDPHIDVFRQTVEDLLLGLPVGAAMEYFNLRYAQLATFVTALLHDERYDREVDPAEVVGLWTANNDARSYVLLGDPAVRLAVDET